MVNLNTIDLRLLLCFVFAGGITFFLLPSIVEIAQKKQLVAVPNGRTTHKNSIPNLGGIAIFIGFIISYLLFIRISYFPSFQYLIAGAFILFFVGFKDDLINIPAFQKLAGELAAAWIIISFGNLRLTSLYGFFSINELQMSYSYLISIITIIGITNSINLMDGIDGLSSGLVVIISVTFGTWFYLVGDYNWAMLTVGLTGSLLPFFYYNVFGKTNKIFMGDTGSLTIGFMISLVVIHFNEMNINPVIPLHISSAPVVSIGILFLPVFDTLRVMLFRTLRKQSPFFPDKTHIHHFLLDMGLNHLQSTGILLGISVFFIGVAFLIKDLPVIWGLVILLVLGMIKTFVAYRLSRKALERKRNA